MLNLSLSCFSLALILTLIISLANRSMRKKRFLLMVALWCQLAGVTCDVAVEALSGMPGPFIRMALEVLTMTAACFGIVTGVAIMVYIHTDSHAMSVGEHLSDPLISFLFAINVINMGLLLSNPITHLYYHYGADNTYVRGPCRTLYSVLLLVQATLMIPVVLRLRHRHGTMTTVRLLLCGLLVISGIVAEMVFAQVKTTVPAVSLTLVLLSVGVQTRLEEDLAQTRAELAESRVRLLSGQIHPHFIFNSLSAIKALVSEDVELAEQAIQDFSDYLRSHLDVMSSSRLVPFAEEMGHVSHYVSLEMADPSRPMQVTYDFETEDFMVPPLTVQPLVENAIRHGVRMRENGGTVEVRTRLADSGILVIVRDDGKGVSSVTERQEHRRKVGIDNVRERIERQCSGSLEVASTPQGTTVTLTIPRGGDL